MTPHPIGRAQASRRPPPGPRRNPASAPPGPRRRRRQINTRRQREAYEAERWQANAQHRKRSIPLRVLGLVIKNKHLWSVRRAECDESSSIGSTESRSSISVRRTCGVRVSTSCRHAGLCRSAPRRASGPMADYLGRNGPYSPFFTSEYPSKADDWTDQT